MKNLKQIFLITFCFPLFILGQCVEGDCKNGKGQYKLRAGLYTGEFLEGNIHGEGSFVTKRGYSYSGNWIQGAKQGFGEELFRKGLSYEGNFSNNQRHGYGKATLPDTKFMKEARYWGQWHHGTICGKGTLVYTREVKYGREKVVETNTLAGQFFNGVFQGRLTQSYSDELIWEPFNLTMTDFQKNQKLSQKERKKLKNPATIQGDFAVSCECMGGALVFESKAIFRRGLSWWSTEDIPAKTKTTVLNTMQGEFDIVEWHARALQLKLNKQKLSCKNTSIAIVWDQIYAAQRECDQVRKSYSMETAWNPRKGTIKNTQIQEKWNNKIAKKLEANEKNNQKLLEKLRKKASKKENSDCHVVSPDVSIIPIIPKPEEVVEEVVEMPPSYLSKIIKDWKEGHSLQADRAEAPKPEKPPREPRSFKPQFPRSQQLE